LEISKLIQQTNDNRKRAIESFWREYNEKWQLKLALEQKIQELNAQLSSPENNPPTTMAEVFDEANSLQSQVQSNTMAIPSFVVCILESTGRSN
jgi:hypothetical protein